LHELTLVMAFSLTLVMAYSPTLVMAFSLTLVMADGSWHMANGIWANPSPSTINP
jgi:hypothetical protein